MDHYSRDLRSLRRVGNSDLWITPVSLGCWPMAGISSLGVTEKECLATIEAALESGVSHFDTAYSYGYDGEADRYLRLSGLGRLPHVVIGSKVGSYYDSARVRKLDARPETLKRHAEEILKRLNLDKLDLLYLHTPDGVTPIEQSAQALADLQEAGIARFIGLSNASPDESFRFASVVKPVVVQPPFNMLQQDTLRAMLPFCKSLQCGAAVYWPLMKGLLTGSMSRDHRFDPRDRRTTYPMYQGEAWQRNQDFLDGLRRIAAELGWSVSQLVVRWTMEQPGVTTVLCGARRPQQIQESAAAMRTPLSPDIRSLIHGLLEEHGPS